MSHSPRTWAALLAVAFTLVLVPSIADRYLPNTWLVGDGGFYLNIQKAITQYGTIEQSRLHPQSWYKGGGDLDDAFSNVSLGRGGEWWPKHSVVMPIAALPFYWLFGVTGTLIFNALTILAMVVLSYDLARRLMSSGLAAGVALAVGVAGPFLEYAYNFSNDGFYTVLLLGGLSLAARDRPGASGLLFGLAVWTKITNVLVLPAFLGVLAWRGLATKRPLWRFGLFAGIPIALYGLANWHMFGAPWITSYQRVIVVSEGTLTTSSHTELFTNPMGEGLWWLMAWYRRGLLTGYPLTAVAWLGLIPLLRRPETRRLALGLAASAALLILFYSRYHYYQERFLFPYFCLAVVPGTALCQWGLDAFGRLQVGARRSAMLAGAVVLALTLGRAGWALLGRSDYVLSDHIDEARVFLGTKRCDYFNNMRWAWECLPADKGDAEFVGVNRNQQHRFDGAPESGLIFARGHSSRQLRRVIFPEVPLQDELVLRYGLDDDSAPPYDSEITIYVGHSELYTGRAVVKGELQEAVLDTTAYAGTRRDVTFVLHTRQRERARFCFDGFVR